MRSSRVVPALVAGVLAALPAAAVAQEPPTPASEADQLPPVEVIQKQPSPAPAAKKKAAAKKKQVSPAPQGPAPDFAASTSTGARGPDGRVIDGAPNLSPVDPSSGILPSDMQDYVGAGTRVSQDQIDEQRPKDNHELLTKVPGVMVVGDDGAARHSNIGVRGSPVRRSRKVLVLEDGQSINMSSYIDPSTHYTPPTDRLEGVEVLRGYAIPFAPLNNYGIINFQNLNPFGESETVISGSIGTTSGANKNVNNNRHVHTRQNAGNVGVVASYSGSDAGGAWDNQVLRYNDFYGAIGWKGVDQDLTISGVYFNQHDNYDEDNFEADDNLPNPEGQFFANGRSKAFVDGHEYNKYFADYFRGQIAHNWYIDPDTTLSTRIYGHDHERNRFSSRNDGPAQGGWMRGRNRHYAYWGGDSRLEFANQGLFGGGTSQDIQIGASYERHSFRNCTSFGQIGEVLNDDNTGNCFAGKANGDPANGRLEKFDSDAVTIFAQSAMHLTRDLTVTPGVRFAYYDVRRNGIYTGNPSAEPDPVVTPGADEIEGAGDLLGRQSSSFNHVLPGIAFSWNALDRSTLYGGYHRGFTPSVARGELYPLPEEIGDNFQIGFKSTAVKGLTFDVAYFYSIIDDYQIKEAETTGNTGANVYGTVDEVEINGVELYARLDSQPFTGGAFNLFSEVTYTFADSIITKGDAAEVGKYLPEVPRHFANLTVGVEEKGLWNASVTWTHVGWFYTDTENTPYGGHDEGAQGLVPDVWLLSARANYMVPNTGLTLFVSGQNLEDKLYIADRVDGMVPGVGRTLWAGFKMKLQ